MFIIIFVIFILFLLIVSHVNQNGKFSMEKFKNEMEPRLKQILTESKNPIVVQNIDLSMGDEPVFNFLFATQQELSDLEKEIQKQMPEFQLKKMPYSPYFLIIPGIQRD